MPSAAQANSPVLTRALRLEVLSPIHVGNDREWRHDLDYVWREGKLYAMDFERALPKLEAAGFAFQRWSQLLKPAEYESCARFTVLAEHEPQTVLSTFRTPEGIPYLPGSTLKGALRTGVLSALLAGKQRLLDQATRRPSASPARSVEQDLLGRDPNHDLLRALHVGDIEANASSDAMVARVLLHTLRGSALAPKGASYRWDVEVLPAGTVLQGMLSLDTHLLAVPRQSFMRNDPRSGLASDMARNRGAVGDNLFRSCNVYARHLVTREIDFFERCGLDPLATFHRGLQSRLDQIGQDPRRALVRIGWGTGWRAKTVSPQLEENAAWLEEFRRRFRLGRPGAPLPKTRRLVESRGRHEVLGWAELSISA